MEKVARKRGASSQQDKETKVCCIEQNSTKKGADVMVWNTMFQEEIKLLDIVPLVLYFD